MTKIAIIDYGMSNLHSVARALQYASPEASIKICNKSKDISEADRIILPGQGAMSDSMMNLEKSGLLDIVKETINNKPVMGICVGQQMLFESSEEGNNTTCLSLLKGHVHLFKGEIFAQNDVCLQSNNDLLKVPHIGWNKVRQCQKHYLWTDIPNNTHFYFVHSYYVKPVDSKLILGETDYGISFASAIVSNNIFAVQFHPEKSSKNGLILYRNFVNWKP
ncbi:imidazole glycerol phosphate synthase subunit HisH [Candidatus Kinetoplastidibacterium crithidiae]|uniref:Imidazole glycerol phosphate synthase subunit HisH n=1 Tax=Candidatus Kinetoplastidibacterium crithidiae TCC036E TaxID=1208918 RepID=M1LVP5_9PROT|nr:imidazole glycerol phosphate synthase subunit HisH [Candidatus Kinetoplastibacterium crithidii]AFZ83047.1 imidazole glycerol phosphate synthase subunit HisH [Candidatus Kinetoplastibacterium crithidii (ex Angomonas deanei ATCC 30255)]AGF47324.1 glutamine amidotransferase [Candidatus Kinetoplastibacterium crithidii TCC036E]